MVSKNNASTRLFSMIQAKNCGQERSLDHSSKGQKCTQIAANARFGTRPVQIVLGPDSTAYSLPPTPCL